jgi:hypothetical protein
MGQTHDLGPRWVTSNTQPRSRRATSDPGHWSQGDLLSLGDLAWVLFFIKKKINHLIKVFL